jgi:hypothetical protein
MEAWNTEKFIRAYEQTKKFDSKDDTKFNSAGIINNLLQYHSAKSLPTTNIFKE